MIHNCIDCDIEWECGHGNPCSDHGEKQHCDKCFEIFMDSIFQANNQQQVCFVFASPLRKGDVDWDGVGWCGVRAFFVHASNCCWEMGVPQIEACFPWTGAKKQKN